MDEIVGGPGGAMSLHFGKTQTSGMTLFLDERLRGGDSGIEDREMCDELGSIRVELRRARPLRPVADGYHPHVNKNLTYNINNINVLKIHSAKLFLLWAMVLTVDTFLNPRKRLGSTGIVSFQSRNTIHLSFSNTEVKVLSKSNITESNGFQCLLNWLASYHARSLTTWTLKPSISALSPLKFGYTPLLFKLTRRDELKKCNGLWTM